MSVSIRIVVIVVALGACWVTASRLAAPGSVALAQTVTPTPPGPATNPPIQAPKGHRQPRASDVPTDRETKPDDRLVDEEQRRLDRVLRNICRGC
jgi:hypothetical protein